jgi:hypothetical protein
MSAPKQQNSTELMPNNYRTKAEQKPNADRTKTEQNPAQSEPGNSKPKA